VAAREGRSLGKLDCVILRNAQDLRDVCKKTIRNPSVKCTDLEIILSFATFLDFLKFH